MWVAVGSACRGLTSPLSRVADARKLASGSRVLALSQPSLAVANGTKGIGTAALRRLSELGNRALRPMVRRTFAVLGV